MADRVTDERFMAEALAEARAGLAEGGIPIGAVLVVDGGIVGRGHNRRVQEGNSDPPRRDGLPARRRQAARRRLTPAATMYTTLSPCDMCSGAILLYRIPRVVLAENRTFLGAEELLRSRGIEVCNLDLPEAVELMREFAAAHPELWGEDSGT